MFLCASRLCLSSKLLVSCFVSRRLLSCNSSSSSEGSSFSSSGISGASGGGTRGSAAGGMSTVVDFGFCGVSTTARRFTSDQLCSASRPTLRAYNSFVGSDKMFVCEFAVAEPHARFPPVKQLRCGLPMAWSTHRSVERSQCIVAPEKRNDPSCMTNRPFRQCAVGGRSRFRMSRAASLEQSRALRRRRRAGLTAPVDPQCRRTLCQEVLFDVARSTPVKDEHLVAVVSRQGGFAVSGTRMSTTSANGGRPLCTARLLRLS